MKREGKTVVFDDPQNWAGEAAFTTDAEEAKKGKWLLRRGVWGASGGTLAQSSAECATPELRFNPGIRGWHEVTIRLWHPLQNENWGVYAATSKDPALRILRAEMRTEAFEDLSLGRRQMTGAEMRIDGSWVNCALDSVRFTPCAAPRPLASASKEVCGILDFADCPDDYRPMEACAAEAVRVHVEAGFTSLLWKAYAVRCEYHTRVSERRTPQLQPNLRVSVGHLLDRYDTLTAAADEGRRLGMKMIGWMRINNETSGQGEWAKFGAGTPFHRAHPEMRKRYKTGELAPRMSFAWPEVRQYLCEIGHEILEHGVDGLAIDVLRHPPMVLYDQPLVDAFLAQTGRNPLEMEGDGDEEWLRFRARAFTDLLRDFRGMMDAKGHRDKPLYVRTMIEPWRNLRDGCDVDAWLREGLVDTLILGHHCIVSPGHASQLDLKPMLDLIAGRARVVAQVMRFTEPAVGLDLARQARAAGTDGVAVYESNLVVTYPNHRRIIAKLRR